MSSVILVFVFFFQQKTAYEMRISDWSSDVCSSDLGVDRRAVDAEALAEGAHPLVILIELLTPGQRAPRDQLVDVGVTRVVAHVLAFQPRPGGRGDDLPRLGLNVAEADLLVFLGKRQMGVIEAGLRSEEHTSELQSLMRISYAVFCLTTQN